MHPAGASVDATRSTTPTRRDPASALWLVTAVAWLAMLGLMLTPAGMAGMPSMAAADLAGGSAAPVSWLVAVFAGGWMVMVVAMMLPTTIPMARAFLVVTAVVPSRRAVRGAFAGAYVVVWLAAGLIGLVGAALVVRATGGVPDGLLLAGALALAGGFQFSPLKRRCLTLCREPRAFLFTRYRRGVGAAFTLGVRHAVTCVGCCWALMVVMFAVGTAAPLWMLGLTAVMVAEKTASWGRRTIVPLGVALLIAAVAVATVALVSHHPVPGPVPMPMHHEM